MNYLEANPPQNKGCSNPYRPNVLDIITCDEYKGKLYSTNPNRICFDNYKITYKWVEDLTLILYFELIRFGFEHHIHESLAGNPDISTMKI